MKSIVIRRFNGYVTEYNEQEQSCEWVNSIYRATQFKSLMAATKAAALLDLEDFELVEGTVEIQ